MHSGDYRAEAMSKVNYGYLRRDREDDNSPFRLMYVIEPRIMASNGVVSLGKASKSHRLVEMGEAIVLAAVVERSRAPLNAKGGSYGSSLETKC